MIFVSETERPLFLASVANSAEAAIAAAGGADIIDAKDPMTGALGALSLATVSEIAQTFREKAAVSATIGDLPCSKDRLVPAACAMAETGVDIVKVGFFGDDDPREAIAALGHAFNAFRGPTGSCLVAVVMADRPIVPAMIPALAAARFFGVMLDTADKSRGSLTTVQAAADVRRFVEEARSAGLFAGLAGSLSIADIAELVQMQPDALGFRGALCDGGRQQAISAQRTAAVRRAIDDARLSLAS